MRQYGSIDYGFFKNTPDFSGVHGSQLVLSELKVTLLKPATNTNINTLFSTSTISCVFKPWLV
nr:MAG TPA: hypothetical protein [Caudoviricetes sp.]